MSEHIVVYVEWTDAISDNMDWTDEQDAKEWGSVNNWRVKQVGFIIDETSEYLLLGTAINVQEEGDRISGVFKIPKECIIRRGVLGDPSNMFSTTK